MTSLSKAVIIYITIFIISFFGMLGLSVSAWFLQHALYMAGILEAAESIALGCGIVFVLCIPVGIVGVITLVLITNKRQIENRSDKK